MIVKTRWMLVPLFLSMGVVGCDGDDGSPEEVSPQSQTGQETPVFPPPEEATRANIEQAFRRIEASKYAAHVQESFTDDATFIFNGPSSIAGTYTGKPQIIAGFDRLFSRVPIHHFTLEQIQVENGPDQVTARVSWRDDAQAIEGQDLPARGNSNILIGPSGVIREELTIIPDDPSALE